MRLKVVVPVLLLGALALIGVLLLGRRSHAPVSQSPPVALAEVAPAVEPAVSSPALQDQPMPEAPQTNSTTAPHEAYVAQRCAELEDLGMDDKPESLASILEELSSREPEIRQAALNAAVQFGSREAIPRLLEAVSQTEDEDEKVALLQAVKFLRLPTLSELAAQLKTNPAAAKP